MFDDVVNECREKALEADGFIFGTPVHYAAASGNMTAFMDRLFYSEFCGNGGKAFAFKPAATVTSARRAGTTATFDQINKYYSIPQMPVIPSRYWNMVHGAAPDEVRQNETGADIFSVKTSVQYPGDRDKLIAYAQKEQDEKALPEITSHIENFGEYDTIFIGYPIWWYDLPQIMYSFFDEYDFSGKTIIPFCVHNGSQFTGTIEKIQEIEPNANVITDGFTVSEKNVSNAAHDVAKWIDEIDY